MSVEKPQTVREVLLFVAENLDPKNRWIQGAKARDRFGREVHPCKFLPKNEAAVQWDIVGLVEGVCIVSRIPIPSVLNAIRSYLGVDLITEWQDRPERTQAEVVAALRAAAKAVLS